MTAAGHLDPERIQQIKDRENAAFVAARPRSAELWAKASMPNGVPMSWLRASYDHPPLFVAEGKDARFRDVDGHEYFDFNIADMSMFGGYGPEPVVEAISRRAALDRQFPRTAPRPSGSLRNRGSKEGSLMKLVRPLLFLGLMTTGLLTVSAPALATSATNTLGKDPFVVITGSLVLPAGSTASDAIIFNGDATIAGDVTGSVIALNGDVTVSGTVGKDVVAVNGTVTVAEGALVGGDVVSRYLPTIANRSSVDGQIRRTRSFDVNLGQLTSVGRVLIWLASSVSSFLLGLLLVLSVPKALDATARTATERFGASIGFGCLMLIGLPIVAFVAIGVVLGIPLGLGILLALGLLYWLGYTAGAYALGRRLVAAPAHRLLAFLAGWGILRGLALIPVVAGLVWLCVTVWGLGALVIAARTAGRADSGTASVATSVTGAPPIPPPPPIPVG